MVVMAPANEAECRDMLYTAYRHQGPAAVRYPRGSGPGRPENKVMNELPLGCAQIIRTGKRIAILAFGTMVSPALEAADSLDATVVNMRFVKPLDESLILEIAESHDMLITVEENTVLGGAGSGVAEVLRDKQFTVPMLSLGLPDNHIEHGSTNDMLAACGLDATGIHQAIEQAVQSQLAPILESA
jgi:1-deoxy-D-xylulose-5-phosphate synthase